MKCRCKKSDIELPETGVYWCWACSAIYIDGLFKRMGTSYNENGYKEVEQFYKDELEFWKLPKIAQEKIDAILTELNFDRYSDQTFMWNKYSLTLKQLMNLFNEGVDNGYHKTLITK